MKKKLANVAAQHDELRSEYAFDYQTAKVNRFAGQADAARTVVVLDPELSAIFVTPDAVNKVLRALVKNMPRRNASSKNSVLHVA